MCIVKQKWYLWPWTALRAKASTVKCFTMLVTNIPLYLPYFGASSLDAAEQNYYFSQDSTSRVKHLSALTDQDSIGRKKNTKAQ